MKKDFSKGTERRAELKSLTTSLKAAAMLGQIAEDTPNNMLKKYYASKGHKVLKTFAEWKQLGYIINKGEHALLLWSNPKEFTRKITEVDESGEEKLSEEKYDTFSYICLFSDKQVTKDVKKSA